MRVALAPMDGITDCAYRIICKDIFLRRWNANDTLMLWTEFMSASGFYYNPPWVLHHALHTDYDAETIIQIFGGDTDHLIHTAQILDTDYSFGGIELNMWCPSPKIMSCAAGSGMLKDKNVTLDILKRIAQTIKKPFSIKTRAWLTEADKEAQFQFLLEASKYVRCISIHGRTYTQSHAWTVDWDFIYRLKAALPNTIIIGNGWLRSYNEMVERQNGEVNGISIKLDGMMPAQSAIGNPRILTPHTPTIDEKRDTIRTHLDLMMAQEHYLRTQPFHGRNEQLMHQPKLSELREIAERIAHHPSSPELSTFKTPIEFRKFLFAYLTGIPNGKALKKAIPAVRTYEGTRDLIQEHAAHSHTHSNKNRLTDFDHT
jgi:tRNA-dihydrouridine synthase